MRKLLRKILQVLDGTPALYGKRQRGQSVLEMAFITPILIVLILGTVEVGWFTNNYLILMEVTRVGARRATILEGDDSPIGWERDAVKYTATPMTSTTRNLVRDCNASSSGTNPDPFGFYNIIACVMIQSMSPLAMNDTNGEDDIIISAFSLQTFQSSSSLPASVPTGRAVVVAQYPSNANECVSYGGARDPFDYFHLGAFDPYDPANPSPDQNSPRVELDGYDTVTGNNVTAPFYPADPSRQVGFVMYGQHEIPATVCLGSEFTLTQIENMFNLNNMGLDTTTRQYMPAVGVTLAEVYWQHRLLLQFPAFSPLFRADRKSVV